MVVLLLKFMEGTEDLNGFLNLFCSIPISPMRTCYACKNGKLSTWKWHILQPKRFEKKISGTERSDEEFKTIVCDCLWV